VTPAMKARLTEHVWEVEEMLKLLKNVVEKQGGKIKRPRERSSGPKLFTLELLQNLNDSR
jgi:hypothetical protein